MPLYRRAGSPHWWVRIGRKTRKSTGTADRKQAEEFEHILRDRIWRLNKLGDRSAVSWNEAAETWLKSSSRPKKRDREILAWLKPSLGEQPLSAVADRAVYEEIRADALAQGWSHATADRVMGTVSAVLKSSAANAPPVPMYGEPSREPRWLTPEQFQRLCVELPEHLSLAARFAVLTMLRMRSMLSLTWDRVDLKKGRAWIPGAQMKGRLTHGLPLSPEAVEVLRALRRLNPSGSRVFQWIGEPVDDCNTLSFKKAVERAKLAPLRWHDLRHTGASWAVQNGVPLQQLMELGGWKDYRSVLRYSHLAPDHLATAAKLVGQMSHSAKRPKSRKRA